MERFAEIPVLLVRHPEIDVARALDAIDTTLAGEPVDFTRPIRVAERTGVIVACARGIELGWISPASIERLAAHLDRYKVVSANYDQAMFFGCMIRLKLVRLEMLSGERSVLDRAVRALCVPSH